MVALADLVPEIIGFLGSDAPGRQHPVELPEHALLLFARPGPVRVVGHDRTLA
jgi:hypothetical protein